MSSEVFQQGPLDLSSIFELRFRDTDVFEGDSPPYGWGAAYGGLLVAQAQWAATLTVPDTLSVHSIHAYFLRMGRLEEPVRYNVERVRDGRSFATRRVVGQQSSGEIFSLSCSFHIDEPSPAWHAADFPGGLGTPADIPRRWDAGIDRRDALFENDPPRVATWLRYPDGLEDDPRLHACGLSYLSDLNAIDAGVAAHPEPPPAGQWSEAHVCLSLDHSIWFHRAARCDRWLLFDLHGSHAANTRVFGSGKLYTEAGEHVATVAQEALFRAR